MPPESKAPRALSVEKLGTILETNLEDEHLVLSAMIQALSRGELPPTMWSQLREAAERDDRLLEVAAAYDEQSQPRLLRRLSPAQQAEVLYQAGEFLHLTLEDAEGAQAYLERAVAADPSHRASFDRLETMLIESASGAKLCDLYLALAAQPAPREEQQRLLRRAAELADVFSEEISRQVQIQERLLKLDPADRDARRALELLYRRARRWPELAKLMEQGLAQGADAGEQREAREQLLGLYLNELGQPDRAIGHVEDVLRLEPVSEAARAGARALLGHKMLGVRAALALESALDRSGESDEQRRVLAALIESTRGAQRAEAQRRLARVLLRAGDEVEAFGVLEKLIASEAGDDELRGEFRRVGGSLGRTADVARALLRASSTARGDELKARLNLEGAEALFEVGEGRKARAPLQAAADLGDAGVRWQALVRLETLAEEDGRGLVEVRERMLAAAEAGPGRAAVAARLGETLEKQGDDARALEAWRAAWAQGERARARPALEGVLTRLQRWGDLVELLESADETDEPEARRRWERAAQLRSEQLGDAAGALEAWERIERRFGASEAVSRRRRELLESSGRHAELVAELVAESRRQPSSTTRGELWGLVAQLRSERLGDAAGALSASREALSLVPGEPRAAAVATRLLESTAGRLSAAEGLEPIYREQGDFWGLVRTLEIRGLEAGSVDERLAALAEAVDLVATDDPARALRLSREGLKLAIERAVARAPEWLVRLELLSSAMSGPAAHAALLLEVLGDRELRAPELIELARRATQSLLESGQARQGLELFGRMLVADPSRVELAPGLERTLQAAGAGEARASLWRLVLGYERAPERRAEVLRLLATIEQQQGQHEAALEAWRGVLALRGHDDEAQASVIEQLRALGRREELESELEATTRALPPGDPRRVALAAELSSLALALRRPARAAWAFGLLLDEHELSSEQLVAAEQVATEVADQRLLQRALEARVARSSSDQERAALLERLVELLPSEQAFAARRQAADLRAALGQVEPARALHRQVLAQQPDDRATLDALLGLAQRAGDLADELELRQKRLGLATDAEDEVAQLLDLVEPALRAGKPAAVAAAVQRPKFSWSPGQQARALSAQVSAQLDEPGRREETADTFRRLIELTQDPQDILRFEAFLARGPRDERWRLDRRWLLSWQVDHAADPTAALLAWGASEEDELGAEAEALALYRRALALQPSSLEAHRRLVALLLRRDDEAGALEALRARRALDVVEERRSLDHQIASLLVHRLERASEAFQLLLPWLEAEPEEETLALLTEAMARASAAGDEAATARAREALERAAQRAPAERAVDLFERLLASGERDPDRRQRWYEELLQRAEQEPAVALRVALRAVDEAPLQISLWENAEQIARRLQRPDEVIEAYRTHLTNPALAATIGQRAIEFHEEWFDDPEGVVALVERVLIADVGARWAFDRLKVFYGADERWGELLSLYDRMVEAARSDGDRIVFLEDAVQIARDFAGDDVRALGYLERLLELRPGDEDLQASLERLYERTGRHRALIELLTRRLPHLEVAEAQAQRLRIASLWLDGLSDVPMAFGALERMLAIEPESPEAFALLERLLATFQRGSSVPVPAAYLRAAALLKERYQREQRHAELARVLEIELEGATTDAQRAERLRTLLALRTGLLDDAPGAFEDALALVGLVPEERELAQLDALAERLGLRERQASVLAELAAARAGEGAARLWLHAARVASSHLGDSTRALDWYGQSLAVASPSIALAAARERAALLGQQPGRSSEHYEALSAQADLEPEVSQRKPVLVTMAALAREVLREPERTAQAWQRRLADDPADLTALTGLLEAYEAQARWTELAATLQRRAELGEDAAQARSDLLAAVTLLRERLADPAGALGVWEKIRARFGDDEQTTEASAGLLQLLGRFADLAALLRAQIPAAPDATRKARWLLALGEVERLHLHHPLEAVEAYEQALGLDPSLAPARDGLIALCEIELSRPFAVDALLLHYRRTEDWSGEVSLLELRLQTAPTDEHAQILIDTAAILQAHESDPAAAFSSLRRALALRPEDTALATSTLLAAQAAGQLAEGIESLRRAARDPAAAAQARWLWTTIAEQLREVEPAGADEAYEQALTPGEDAALLRALVSLRRSRGGEPLAVALERLASVEHDAPGLLLEAARLRLDDLHDAPSARALALRLLALSPEQHAWDDLEPAIAWATSAVVEAGPVQLEPARRIEILRRVASLPYPDLHRAALLRQAAALGEEIAELSGAIEDYRRVLLLLPDDLGALERLAVIHRQLGQRVELRAVLGLQIARTSSAEERTSLRLSLAHLLHEDGDDAEAIVALQQALVETPAHADAAALLARLFATTGRSLELVTLVEQQAALREAQGDASAAEQWAEAAHLAEQNLRDLDRTIADHRRAAALGRRASLEALVQLLLDRHELAEATAVLERLAEGAQGEELVRTWTRLADVYLASERPALAREVLERSLDVAADPTAIRARLADLYREAGQWASLAALRVAEAATVQEPRARVAVLNEAIELLLARQNDPASAVPLLQQVVSLVPEDSAAHLLLGESLRRAGQLPESIASLRRLVESYGQRRPKERALAHLQLGLTMREASDLPGAIAEFELAARIDPAHPRILHALGLASLEAGELDRAQKSLRSLLLLLPRGARGDQGVTRLEVQLGLADIAQRQGDLSRADELIESAFSHARDHEGDLPLLEANLRSRNLLAPLARALELRRATTPADQQLPLLLELASLYQTETHQPAEALEHLLRALPLAPADTELRQRTTALALSLGQLSPLLDVLHALAPSVDSPALAFDLWLSSAALAEGTPRDAGRIRAALQHAEALAPGLPDPDEALAQVWPHLEQVLRAQGDRLALVRLLQRRRNRAAMRDDSVGQAEVLYQITDLLLAPPSAPEEALAYLDEALALAPDPERTASLLRRAVAAHGEDEQVLRFYERFSRQQGDRMALIDALERLGGLPDASTATLREAAELALEAELDDRADVILRVLSELDQNPTSLPDVIWALVTLAARVEQRGDAGLAASLKERAAELTSPDQRQSLLREVAALAQEKLHDEARAVRIYRSLLEESPDDETLWRPLLALLQRAGDEAPLLELLERLLPVVDAEHRAELRSRLIDTLLREREPQLPGATERATALLQEALLEEPTRDDLAERLTGLLERSGNRAQLADHLERLFDAARERSAPATSSPLALRLGALYEQLGDARRARDVYHAALGVDPRNASLLRSLLALAERRDDAAEVSELLERLLDATSGPEAVPLALRLAALHDANWSPDDAERALERGYAAHPDPALRDALRERYRENDAWDKLASLIARDASTLATPAAQAAALREAAQILRTHRSDPGAASELLQQALALQPADPRLLTELLQALGALSGPDPARRAVEALTRAIEHRPAEPELLRLRGEQLSRAGTIEAALADLEASLAAGHAPARESLLSALRQAIPLARGAVAQRALRLRLAALLTEAGQLDEARAPLADAVRAEPSQPEALRALADLERRAGRWADALAPLQTLAQSADGDALVEQALVLADVAERAGQPAAARSALERALQAAPRQRPLRDRLRAVYERIGARRELAQLLRDSATILTEPGPRFEALLASARLLLDPTDGDPRLAAQTLDEARALRPDDLDLALLQADVQVSMRRPREALQLLDRVVVAHRGKRSKLLGQVYQRKAQVELSLGERPAALASLGRAFDNDGANGALAHELGTFALEMNDEQAATRAFRAITLMKSDEGAPAATKAQAYYQLSLLALGQADRRKARLLAEKALSEDPSLEPARLLRDELKNG